MQQEKKEVRLWARNSVSGKMIVIGILALVLLIPAAMIEGVIHEREWRNTEVTREIGGKWGAEQTVTGPVLKVPYLTRYVTGDGKTVTNRHELYLLPDQLQIDAQVQPEKRMRGIYEAVVYTTQVTLQGSFDLSLVRKVTAHSENIEFGKATILLGIADLKGVRERIVANVNGAALEMNPGLNETVVESSVGAPVPGLKAKKSVPFNFTLVLNGSSSLSFVPVGKETTVTMGSPWSNPSFNGAFLPVERQVSDSGFSARWNVLHFNRDLPQVWSERQVSLYKHAFGASFLIPADIYQQSMRSAKYAVLFIGFTFSAFFIAEVLNRRRIHPVQYLLIGFALVLFYILLISISEHLSFALAYLLATLAVIGLIASYAASVLRSRRLAGIVAVILAALYGYMFVLLNLEDYALLMGAVGLFAVLAAIMYLTRKIDWYAAAADPA